MSKRTTLKTGEEALADLLDQPFGTDPYHPHLLTKPSANPPADVERVKQLLVWHDAVRRQVKIATSRDVDRWKHTLSALAVKLGNCLPTKDDRQHFSVATALDDLGDRVSNKEGS